MSPVALVRQQQTQALRAPQAQAVRTNGQSTGRAGALPATATLPPPPRPAESAEVVQPTGVAAIGDNLVRASAAQVDAAKKSFWGKFFTTAMTLTGLALFTVATGGVGAFALTGIALTGLFLLKSSADSASSFCNWRNLQAQSEGKPEPYPFRPDLPQALRGDALASLLHLMGYKDSTALSVSRGINLGLGLAAATFCGASAAGWPGVGLTLLPLGTREKIKDGLQTLESDRQAHTQSRAEAMRSDRERVFDLAAGAYGEVIEHLQHLRDRELAAAPQPLQAQIVSQYENKVRQFQQDHAAIVEGYIDRAGDGLQRIERKAGASTAGTAAIAVAALTEEGSRLPDMTGVTPLPVFMVGVMALRLVLEAARSYRSINRDEAKFEQARQTAQDARVALRELVTKALQGGEPVAQVLVADQVLTDDPLAPRQQSAALDDTMLRLNPHMRA